MLISISPVSSIIFTKSETEMLSSLEARTTLTFWPSRETKISLMRQKVDKYTTDKCLFDCDNKVTKGGGEQQTKITMMKLRQREPNI